MRFALATFLGTDAGPAQALLGLGLVLATACALTAILYGRGKSVLPVRTPVHFNQHLKELSQRLVRVTILFLYWSLLFVTLRFQRQATPLGAIPAPVLDIYDNAAARIYQQLAHLAVPPNVDVVVLHPMDAIATQLQIALLLGFTLTLPAIAYEVWAFFHPGLTHRERNAVARSLPFIIVLFVAGAVFGAGVIAPFLIETLYGFAAPLGAAPLIEAPSLVGTLVAFAFAFGLAFQTPLVLVLLVRLRVTTPRRLASAWRHVTVASLVLGAFFTDPTIISQIFVAGVLLVLYWGGVGVAWLLQPAVAPQRPAASGSKA